MTLDYEIQKPKDGFITLYTYETLDSESDQFNVSGFCWTTGEAMLALATSYTWYNGWRIVKKEFAISDLKKWGSKHFVSGLVYEMIQNGEIK
jgi:hypothetical protein